MNAILSALYTAIILGVGTGSVVASESPARGAERHVWKVYTNVRFQYSICYPEEIFIPRGEAENSDGQTFVAKDGAKLVVFGRNNALGQSLQEAFQDTVSRLTGDSGKVTYKVMRPDWFVVSGENGQNVFYAKMIRANEQFKSFEINYNSSASKTYRPIVTRLASCLVNSGR